MSKQLFNADGVTRKISELQALPDADLKTETDSIRTNFQSWMLFNFNLNTEQATYLLRLDQGLIQELADGTADCMQYNLPFYVTFPPVPTHGSKLVLPQNDLVRINDPIKGDIVTGQFRIVIEYK